MTATATKPRVDEARARDMLAQRRIAVVGASPSKGNFGGDVAKSLRSYGRHVVTVHPAGLPVDGLPCYRSLDEVPGEVDAVIVMVRARDAADVVRAAAERGIGKVWLFQGVGAGAVAAEALAEAEASGIEVVPGACPLMFLEPAPWVHRVHRSLRRARHTLD